ncbi:hypothetical protein M436DRAFT_64159 [Aureobasidium namibiae CBS 147.97]|uniref:Uncharacterized protein n=1 Tax=Aureobasidium namibiae CBS 147.97 TaxID=1043004 RepID=A0A074XEF8_9PEZI|nr:uncharacterized protein M436DRAFT_64159 [Aureobasidium namibiae CBS 147.97]KEQ72996.1 hypothetical protein M436DRAFT_64159 [Aureobasidium namibiae CBS 147.97]
MYVASLHLTITTGTRHIRNHFLQISSTSMCSTHSEPLEEHVSLMSEPSQLLFNSIFQKEVKGRRPSQLPITSSTARLYQKTVSTRVELMCRQSLKRQLLGNNSIKRQLLRTITPGYHGMESSEQRMNALSTNSSLRPITLIDLYFVWESLQRVPSLQLKVAGLEYFAHDVWQKNTPSRGSIPGRCYQLFLCRRPETTTAVRVDIRRCCQRTKTEVMDD